MSNDPNIVLAHVAQVTNIRVLQVKKVLELLFEEQNTIPFITRYRKEATGGLDEVQIGDIKSAYEGYLEREKRRAYILETIATMEKLTPELEKKIKLATTLQQLEDIYAPYKSKKKTKGQLAIDAGLVPLVDLIKTSGKSIEVIQAESGESFINPEHKITNFEEALDGCKAIIVEEISHHVELKEYLRTLFWKESLLVSEKRKDAEKIDDYDKYKDYFEFSQKIADLKDPKISHRFLALRRGAMQKVLKLEVQFDDELLINTVKSFHEYYGSSGCKTLLERIFKLGGKRIHTSLELEIKSDLKLVSDESAITVFGKNLQDLLLQPYLGAKAVVGIDPGIRTGCKIAIVDSTGKFLVDTIIYPHAPKNDIRGTVQTLNTIIEKFKVEFFAIGNGTFGRETLQLIKDNVAEVKSGKVKAVLVNEDGASIYSASEIARKEFPDKDPTVRGAISIARRFQDPLAELVKIDPKSIGVGQYQHDVSQNKLKKSLQGIVEYCVNFVGVDLNTASAPLLSYISGIGPGVADNIIKAREKLGGFKDRAELLEISRFTKKIFEQSAGFLRIYNGKNALDSTFIHPESYAPILNWCGEENIKIEELIQNNELILKLEQDNALKEKLGKFTHEDIVKSLRSPRQDPREEFKPFDYKEGVSVINDLKIGETYPGKVTNITKFGAFVDIGIKENGLIHISQISDTFVDDPLKVLKVGQVVRPKIIEIDTGRKRISLSLKSGSNQGSFQSAGPKNGQKKQSKSFKQEEFKNNPFAALKNFKKN